jgi:hypothetical protein
MPTPNYNPQHNFKVCKFKIWFSPTSIPRTSLSKIPMIPHLQKCRCQSAHTKIRQTDPDHHIQTKYHIYNKHSKYKPLHTCNNIKSEWASEGMSDCCLMQKISIFFYLHHDENKLHSMRWCLHYTKLTRLVGVLSTSSLRQQSACRYVATRGHIILIPNQPVFILSP